MGRIQEMLCSWSASPQHSGLRLGTLATLIPAVGTPTPATGRRRRRENTPRKKYLTMAIIQYYLSAINGCLSWKSFYTKYFVHISSVVSCDSNAINCISNFYLQEWKAKDENESCLCNLNLTIRCVTFPSRCLGVPRLQSPRSKRLGKFRRKRKPLSWVRICISSL